MNKVINRCNTPQAMYIIFLVTLTTDVIVWGGVKHFRKIRKV